jgi:hypothetical protein
MVQLNSSYTVMHIELLPRQNEISASALCMELVLHLEIQLKRALCRPYCCSHSKTRAQSLASKQTPATQVPQVGWSLYGCSL